MKKQSNLNFEAAAFLVITLLSASTAVAQNIAFGSGALLHLSASDLSDTAFGLDALKSPTWAP